MHSHLQSKQKYRISSSGCSLHDRLLEAFTSEMLLAGAFKYYFEVSPVL
jgi:hypothetical protein